MAQERGAPSTGRIRNRQATAPRNTLPGETPPRNFAGRSSGTKPKAGTGRNFAGRPAAGPVSRSFAGPGAGSESFVDSFDVGSSAAAPAMSDEDWLSGDSSYQLQLAALLKALSDSEADFTAQRTKYDTDYNDTLRGLGWNKDIADDPATADVNEAMPGNWNLQDLNTASGRAYTNQQNDFASRGLLQSSLYGSSLDNLMRSLNDQLGSINGGRTSFLDDISRQQTAAKSENTQAQQQARAEALARRAAQVGL